MPLEQHEYGHGNTVKSPDGDKYDIRGSLADGTGQRFLVVSKGKSDSCTLVSESHVRDEYEPVTDETDDTDSEKASGPGSSKSKR